MLSDNVIRGFNIHCRRQFEHVAGLQDPLIGQTSQYSIIKNQKFVQILHNSRAHWVAFSTYNCKNGEVNYYDSLFSDRINDFVKQQICALIQADEDVLKINVMLVQRFDEKLLPESLLQMLAEQHIRCFQLLKIM